jgi:hypothetical protein
VTGRRGPWGEPELLWIEENRGMLAPATPGVVHSKAHRSAPAGAFPVILKSEGGSPEIRPSLYRILVPRRPQASIGRHHDRLRTQGAADDRGKKCSLAYSLPSHFLDLWQQLIPLRLSGHVKICVCRDVWGCPAVDPIGACRDACRDVCKEDRLGHRNEPAPPRSFDHPATRRAPFVLRHAVAAPPTSESREQ